MKKALLLTGLAAISAASLAAFEAPETLNNFSVQGVSPDGRYVASYIYGDVQILDRETGVTYQYGQGQGEAEHSLGLGNVISGNGVILGSTDGYVASYWKDGKWTALSCGTKAGLINSSNGITLDGSRICGSVGIAAMSLDTKTSMTVPVIWDRQPDGSYGEYTILPHPDKDIFGAVPQYVTAVAISDDGKTVVGQVVDNSGQFILPLVYTEDENGTWSYRAAAEDVFKPENVVIPVNPGDGPEYVDAKNYLTQEQAAEYQDAFNAWAGAGYQGEMPQPTDYMTEEVKAKYEADYAAYESELAEFSVKQSKWFEEFGAYTDAVPMLQFNDVTLSPDGTTYFGTHIKYVPNDDPYSWFPFKEYYCPAVFNLTDNTLEIKDFDNSMMVVDAISADTYFATNGLGELPMQGYIIENGTPTEIADWLSAKSPELSTWIDENWIHEVETGYDPETYDPIFSDLCFSGMPAASRDMSFVTVWNNAPWSSEFAISYLFDLSQFNGISDAVRGDSKVAFDAEGNLSLSDDITAVEVYDLAGRRVLSGANGARNLENGIYVVRATTAAGNTFSTKIAK